jgi:tetratricopeptide (TPR) repeat protein
MAHSDESLNIPSEFLPHVREAKELVEGYKRTNNLPVLDQAILAWQGILSRPHFASAPQRFRLEVLNDAGGAYLYRYWAHGDDADLNQTLGCWQQAVDLIPSDSPDLPMCSSNLGSGLSARYARTGDLADLEAAIAAYEQAVALTPQDSPDLPGSLNNLGTGMDVLGFHIRHYRVGPHQSGKGPRGHQRLGFKTLIKPAKANVKAHLAELGRIIRSGRAWPQAALIRQLNPKIRGWADYYRTWVRSVTVLSRVTRHASIVQWARISVCARRGECAPGGHGTASSHGDHCRGSS